jgi:hypothetical protein
MIRESLPSPARPAQFCWAGPRWNWSASPAARSSTWAISSQLGAMWQRRRGCPDAARMLPGGIYVALNISPATCLDQRLPGLLGGSGLRLSRLVIQLTERLEVEEYDPLILALAPLRRKGLRIAVDDAGSGFASLRHVLHIRPDIIKLDRSLIKGINDDQGRRARRRPGRIRLANRGHHRRGRHRNTGRTRGRHGARDDRRKGIPDRQAYRPSPGLGRVVRIRTQRRHPPAGREATIALKPGNGRNPRRSLLSLPVPRSSPTDQRKQK